MVLPEIEEEAEEPGLSLTSLMLGQSLPSNGEAPSSNPVPFVHLHLVHLILYRIVQPDGQHWAVGPAPPRWVTLNSLTGTVVLILVAFSFI